MDSSIKPEEVFRSALPVGTCLVEVPQRIDRQVRFCHVREQDDRLFAEQRAAALVIPPDALTSRVGGRTTEQPSKREQHFVNPEVLVDRFSVAVLAGHEQHHRAMSRMGREAKQGEIGVVIEGKYYGITDYAEA